MRIRVPLGRSEFFSAEAVLCQNFKAMRVVSIEFSNRQDLLLPRQLIIFAPYDIGESHVRLHCKNFAIVLLLEYEVTLLLKAFSYLTIIHGTAQPVAPFVLLRGFAIISLTSRLKKSDALAGFMTRAVSAPLPVPAMATTFLSTEMRPASVAITVISTQTLVPSPNSLRA